MTTHWLSYGLFGRIGGLALSGVLHVAVGLFLLQVHADGAPEQGPASGDAGQGIVVELVSLGPGQTPPPPTDVVSASSAAPSHTAGSSKAIEDAQPKASETAAGAKMTGPSTSEQTGAARRLSDLPDSEVLAFRRRLEQHLARHRLYPAEASANGRKGQTTVHFIMTKDGRVIDAWIETSSGENAIDEEALAAIFRAQPLPGLPGDWPSRLDVSLPVNFVLK